MQYSPFLFTDSDVPFLEALRNYLAKPSKETYRRIMEFNVQHERDLALIVFKDLAVAKKDYISIRLQRLRGELEWLSRKELIVTKSSSNSYCAFILGDRLLPVLTQELVNKLENWGYFMLQGNVYIDISKCSTLDKRYVPIKRKTLIIGRHMVHLEGRELLMNCNANTFQVLGEFSITIDHPEHGVLVYRLDASTPLMFDFHTRNDAHLDEFTAKKLIASLP